MAPVIKKQRTRVSAADTELRNRAVEINFLLKKVGAASKKALEALNQLAGAAAELDNSLNIVLRTMIIVDASAPGVGEVRQLKAMNGLNLRTANGAAAHIGRLKNTNASNLTVS